MSLIFTLKGRQSTLSIDLPVPITLDPSFQYSLALIGFHSYNTIPNIEKSNNTFYYIDNTKSAKSIIIPPGAYEITDIYNCLKSYFQQGPRNSIVKEGNPSFFLQPNNNTLKCEIFHPTFDIDFRPENSLADLLGFSHRLLKAGEVHKSDLPVNIVKVRTIHIDSNITQGAYYNDRPSHSIYEFPINSDPGFAIDEVPRNLIYLPIDRTDISNITLQVLDQNSNLVNFRGEEIIIRLELKKWS